MEHTWAYKVESRNGMKISMINIANGENLIISAMDKGWSKAPCP